ncbi:MAG: cadherin-like beta sandwich domain-containing protein, partial [Mobilitalea sp.]
AIDYTVASWQVLTDALALPETTNALVVAKTTEINDAISALVLKADITFYNTALSNAVQADYTASSWSTYQLVVTANTVTAENAQSEVTTAANAIISAQSSLVFAGKANLDTAKTLAGTKTATDYTVASWQVLTDALALPETTNALVVAKTTEITDAISALVVKADFTTYNIALSNVIQVDYTAGSWSTYQLVVAANIVTAENVQSEVTTAANAIISAQSSLVFAGKANLDTAKTLAGTKTAANFTTASWQVLTDALSLPETTNGQVVAKTTAINNGISALVTIIIPAPPTVPAPPMVPATPTSYTEIVPADVKIGDSDATAFTVSVLRTVETDGRKTDVVTYAEDNAKETVDKLREEGKDIARIVITDDKNEIAATTIKIPAASIRPLAENDISLEIDTENARISIPKETIQKADQESTEDLYFNLIPIRNVEDKEQVIARAKKEMLIQLTTDDSLVTIIGTPMAIETNMPQGEVEITLSLGNIVLPTTTKAREKFLNELAVYIEHSDGEKVIVRGEIVTDQNGELGIKFKVTKFSSFTVIQSDKLLQQSKKCDIVKVNLPSATVIIGNKLSLKVTYKTSNTRINLTVNEDATWALYSDADCKKEIANKNMKLIVGKNKAYIKVTAEDGISFKIYSVTITRNKKVVKNNK